MFNFLRCFFKEIQQLEPTIDPNIISYFVSDRRTIAQNFSNNRRHFNKSFQTHRSLSQSQQSEKQTHYQKSNYKRAPQLNVNIAKPSKMLQNQNKNYQIQKTNTQLNQFIQTKSNKILPSDIYSQNEKNQQQNPQNQFINHVHCQGNSSKGFFKTYSHQILSEALKEQSSRLLKSDKISGLDKSDSQTGQKCNCENSDQKEKDISELYLDDELICQSTESNQLLSDDNQQEDQFLKVKRVYEQNRKQIRFQQRKSTNF